MLDSLFLYYGMFLCELFLGTQISLFCKNQSKRALHQGGITSARLCLSIFMVVVCAIPTLIVGLRYMTGRDYLNYERIYTTYVNVSYPFIEALQKVSFEIGFYYLVKFLTAFGGNYQMLLLVSALITYALLVKSIKDVDDGANVGVMLVVMLATYFGPSFNIVKQMIASAILFAGMRYIFKRDFIKYAITVFIASTFHVSAISLIFLYFIYDKKATKMGTREWLILIGTLITPLMFEHLFHLLSNISVLSGYYSDYSGGFSISGTIKTLIFRLPALIPVLVNYKSLKVSSTSRFYILMLIMEYAIICMSFSMHWAFRLSYYFMIAEIVLPSKVLNVVKSKDRWMWRLYYLAYYLLYFFMVFYVWQDDGIFPYASCLG